MVAPTPAFGRIHKRNQRLIGHLLSRKRPPPQERWLGLRELRSQISPSSGVLLRNLICGRIPLSGSRTACSRRVMYVTSHWIMSGQLSLL